MAVEERLFTPEELGQMSRLTIDRAIEAIDAGDSELALELCRGTRHESRFPYDLDESWRRYGLSRAGA